MNTRRHRPRGRSRLVLLTWVGVYPVLTGIAWALEPVLIELPVPIRTLLMSALMVPIMVYGVMPLIHRFSNLERV